jgi:hypothetical protein
MEMRRTRWEALHDKQRAMNAAEESGLVADSMEVRHQLLEKVRKGEATLEQVQAELKKIKRNAKKNGQVTRSQAYSAG